MLGARAAVTEPFTDFGVDRVSRLSLSRTYNSADYDNKVSGRPGGMFGIGWNHDWEASLICDASSCTVLRGILTGFKFSPSASYPSPDGTETWTAYTAGVPPYAPTHHHVLVQRPAGEWIAFLSDGTELHFQRVCTPCDSASSINCKAVGSGGRARLVKVVDRTGNAITIDYAPQSQVLLRLSDELGHSLEVRSRAACASPAYATELRYDGQTVARYAMSSNQLVSVSDGSGAVLRSYTYVPVGTLPQPRLASVQNEAGSPIVQFTYAPNGDAIGLADAESSVSISYGAGGAATVAEYFKGPLGTTASMTVRQLDFFSQVTRIDGEGSCGPARDTQWTPDGRPMCVIDGNGRARHRQFDTLGRVTREVEFGGATCSPPDPLPADARESTFEYGLARTITPGLTVVLDDVTTTRKASTVVPGALVESVADYSQAPAASDPSGYHCTTAPLPAGSVVCREVTSGYVTGTAGPVLERHATFHSYDAKGRVIRSYGPVNLDQPAASDVPIEERTYWPDGDSSAGQGRLREVKRYAAPSAQALVTSFEYDAFGVSRVTGPDGTETLFAKDARGRVTIVSVLDSHHVLRARSETRYFDGLLPRVRILVSGAAERYTYDLRGRLTVVERLSSDPDAPGTSPTVVWVQRNAYDQAGNTIHTERTDGAGRLSWSQDRAYDARHNVVWESNPGLQGAARTATYDSSSLLVQTVDEEGRATLLPRDALGRVSSIGRTGPGSDGQPVTLNVATYLYGAGQDALGEVVDANGHETSYAYDDFGRLQRLVSATLPDTGGRWFRHDARGNVVAEGDSTVTVSYTYDGLDRLLTVQAVNSVDGSSVHYQYVYDPVSEAGRPATIFEDGRTVTYAYDWAGRIVSEVAAESGGSAAQVTEYAYAADGTIAEVTYPSGLVVAYQRDPATGQPTSVRNVLDGTFFASAVQHEPGGALASLVYGNGRPLHQTFDRRPATSSVVSGPTVLAYSRSPAGNVLLVEDTSEDPAGCARDVARTFGYDLQDRLASWSDSVVPGTSRCSAQTLGSQLAGYRYVQGTDRLSSITAADANASPAYAIAYDHQGNVSAIGRYGTGGAIETGICLRHDSLGRLTQVGSTTAGITPGGLACLTDAEVSTAIAQYRYDSRSLRVARHTPTASTYFAYDQNGRVLSELTPTGDQAAPWQRVRDYVWLDDMLLAQVEYPAGTPRPYYVHLDALGTPRAMTNPQGVLVWSTFQRPFGEVGETLIPDPSTGQTVVTNLRLPGQYDERLLGSLGLQGPYYNWNRWYLPGVGRYLEPDPIAMAGGFNTRFGVEWYNYAEGNPLRWADPDGLRICTNWNEGPDRFGSTCTGTDGGTCELYNFTITECTCKDGKYSFDAHVNVSAWREFMKREYINGPSCDSPGMTLGEHENLHMSDYRNAFSPGLDSKYKSEGFASMKECNRARAGFAKWLKKYNDNVTNGSRRHDRCR